MRLAEFNSRFFVRDTLCRNYSRNGVLINHLGLGASQYNDKLVI